MPPFVKLPSPASCPCNCLNCAARMLFCKRQQATTIGSERQQTQILGLGLTQRPSMLSMPSDCWGGPLRATFARQSAPLHAGMFVTPVMLPRLSPALGFHQIRSCTKSQRAPGVVVVGATVSLLGAGIISTWYIQGELCSCGAVPQMPKSTNGLHGRITTFEVVIASH